MGRAARTTLILAIGLLAVAALSQPVAAQELREPHVDVRIPFGELSWDVVYARPDGTQCQESNILLADDYFRFREGTTSAGCALVRALLPNITGAPRLTVSFNTDRIFQSASTIQFPADFTQDLIWMNDAFEPVASAPIFNPNEPATAEARATRATRVAEDTLPAAMGWWFAEQDGAGGPADIATVSTHSALSAVTEIQIIYADLPMLDVRHSEAAHNADRSSIYTQHKLRAVAPDSVFWYGRPSLQFDLPPDAKLLSVEGPKSTLAAGDTVLNAMAERITITIPEQIAEAQGAGTYTVHFEQVAPARADALLGTTSSFALLLPAFAGSFAFIQLRRLAVVAQGGGLTAPSEYRAIFWALTVGYVAGALTLIFTGHHWLMMRRPMPSLGMLYVALLLLVTIAFAVLGTRGYTTQRNHLDEELRRVRHAQAQLERSNRDLEHFAYIASHDLQEPLRTIAGYSQLLQRRYGNQLDDRGRAYVQKTVNGAKRMQVLISDLLAYSRVETKEDAFREVHLGEVIENEIEGLQSLIEERGANIRMGELPKVHGDSSQMAQVFSNLLRNAIKYTPQERRPEIRISCEREPHKWHITVKDNGIGIPEDQFERVFQIFQRLVPRDDVEGTGLGLAITQKIIHRHGGQIWVESEVGKGTTFHITLPTKQRIHPLHAPQAAVQKPRAPILGDRVPKRAAIPAPKGIGGADVPQV